MELLERAKFEMLIENLVRAGSDAAEEDADVKEAILEFASMQLGVEAGLRTLCDAIANFGPEVIVEEAVKVLIKMWYWVLFCLIFGCFNFELQCVLHLFKCCFKT